MMDDVMAQCIKSLSDNITAFGAGLMSRTSFCACRIFIYNPIAIRMTGCRNLLICGITTSRAGIICFISALGAGRRLCVMMHQVVPKGIDSLCDGVAAFGTSFMSRTGFGTCRILIDNAVPIGMTLRADGSACKQFSASRSSSLFKAVMSTVRISYDSPFSFIVSERRNLFIGGISAS